MITRKGVDVMRFTIFARNDEKTLTCSKLLKSKLEDIGLLYDDKEADYVFCLGGDGNFLRAVHQYQNHDHVSFIGFNCGSLGFLCNYSISEIDAFISDYQKGMLEFDNYSLLKAQVYSQEKLINEIYAVNEIRIENPFKTMICDVYIDDEYLEEFRGNGLLVSSTLGSSAYNKSCGGALIDARINLLELTEIAPIENVAYRSIRESIVLNADRKIVFKGPFLNEVIGYDHGLYHFNVPISDIIIEASSKSIRLLKRKFIKSIRKAFIARNGD